MSLSPGEPIVLPLRSAAGFDRRVFAHDELRIRHIGRHDAGRRDERERNALLVRGDDVDETRERELRGTAGDGRRAGRAAREHLHLHVEAGFFEEAGIHGVERRRRRVVDQRCENDRGRILRTGGAAQWTGRERRGRERLEKR